MSPAVDAAACSTLMSAPPLIALSNVTSVANTPVAVMVSVAALPKVTLASNRAAPSTSSVPSMNALSEVSVRSGVEPVPTRSWSK